MDQTMRRLVHRLVDHCTISQETAEELLQRILEQVKTLEEQRREDTPCKITKND